MAKRRKSTKRKTNNRTWPAMAALGVVGCMAFGSAAGAPKADGVEAKAKLSLPAQRAQQAYKAGWPKSELPTVVAVGYAESQLKNSAHLHNTDGSDDNCWLQINSKNKTAIKGHDLGDPTGCAKAGKVVFDKQGWHAWSSVNNRSYLKFMPKAKAAVSEAGLS